MTDGPYKADELMPMTGTVSLFQLGKMQGINKQYTKAPLGGSSRLESAHSLNENVQYSRNKVW